MKKLIIVIVFATILVSTHASFLKDFMQEIRNLEKEENQKPINLQQGAVGASPGDVICQFVGTPFQCWIVNEQLLPSIKVTSLASLDQKSNLVRPDSAWYGYDNAHGLALTPLLLQVNANRSHIDNWQDSSDPFVAVEDETTKTNDDTVEGDGYYWPKLRADGSQGGFRLDTNIGSETSSFTRTQTTVTTTIKTTLTQGGVLRWVDLQELWVLNPFTTAPYGTKIIISASETVTV